MESPAGKGRKGGKGWGQKTEGRAENKERDLWRRQRAGVGAAGSRRQGLKLKWHGKCSTGNIVKLIVISSSLSVTTAGIYTYHAEHFAIYIIVEPLCCTLKPYNTTCQLYFNFLKLRQKEKKLMCKKSREVSQRQVLWSGGQETQGRDGTDGSAGRSRKRVGTNGWLRRRGLEMGQKGAQWGLDAGGRGRNRGRRRG